MEWTETGNRKAQKRQKEKVDDEGMHKEEGLECVSSNFYLLSVWLLSLDFALHASLDLQTEKNLHVYSGCVYSKKDLEHKAEQTLY